MKKTNLKILLVFVLVSALLTGCGLNKMIKKYNTVKYEVTPNPLETHGGKIAVTVKGKFPEKYFHKKASVEFTPVLVYDGGSTTLKSITLKGEKAEGNGTVINSKTGGTFTYNDVIDYNPAMNKSDLEVNAKAILKKKNALLGKLKLADGVIYTSERILTDPDLVLADHGYQKEVIIPKSATIFFKVNMANLDLNLTLNKVQSAKDNLTAMIDMIKKEWKIKNLEINAWASPEGEESRNQGLSDNRSKTAQNYLKDQVEKFIKEKAKALKVKANTIKIDLPVVPKANGEDWDGFMKSIDASSIKDKNAILNVVRSQTDLKKREQEIRNMTVIFKEIEDIILPPLRRADFTVNFFEPKKTDEQIAMFSTTYPDSLKLDELLYAATLTQDLTTQLKIYKSATTIYPTDWKAYNNAAYVLLKQSKPEEAITYLEKANTLQSNNKLINNNMGAGMLMKKDFKNAKSYFETAQQQGATEGYNLGIIMIKDGNYAGALSSFGSKSCNYNVALAQLLSGNAAQAAKTLECAAQSGELNYLMAIVGARTNNTNLLYENLKKAIAANPAYKNQAKDDREFLKFMSSSDFKSAIQ